MQSHAEKQNSQIRKSNLRNLAGLIKIYELIYMNEQEMQGADPEKCCCRRKAQMWTRKYLFNTLKGRIKQVLRERSRVKTKGGSTL